MYTLEDEAANVRWLSTVYYGKMSVKRVTDSMGKHVVGKVSTMGRVVSIGEQSFEILRKDQSFYIDKTDFIREWWESRDKVTLITRPRRFGKTLNMRMLECFFSNKYAGRSDLFEGLNIWKEEKYRKLQGKFPVIFLTFADVKSGNYKSATTRIKESIEDIYLDNQFLVDENFLNEKEKKHFLSVHREMSDEVAVTALRRLMGYLERYYGEKVIILLDEYDTPMQEAYMAGYWNEITEFFRNLFNATFKTNEHLDRAVMTGITRISVVGCSQSSNAEGMLSWAALTAHLPPQHSCGVRGCKESIFSDLNNLRVFTTTSIGYSDCFGFTETEVFAALDEMGMSERKEDVKAWYDGFTFGSHTEIYNPWSITNYLKNKTLETYWADTSSNGLISNLFQPADADRKQDLEILLQGGTVEKEIDEQIIFSQLKKKKNAVWSLMLASGYLRVDSVKTNPATMQRNYTLKLTNLEVRIMFDGLIRGWFDNGSATTNDFVRAMLEDNSEKMNRYMNDIALNSFSYLDTGKEPSGAAEPEKFYHGFVLGLLVDLRGRYLLTSNRESGFGRYDIMLEPLRDGDPAFILEFKVFNPKKEADLEATVAAALQQIEEKQYAAHLKEKGIPDDRIRKYGFAFEGKTVLIG